MKPKVTWREGVDERWANLTQEGKASFSKPIICLLVETGSSFGFNFNKARFYNIKNLFLHLLKI